MATPADFARIGNHALMHNPDANVDRRKAHRTVPMEVLCLGCSRTGTLTMHKALTLLNIPSPYHFSSILGNVRSDSSMWMSAINAKHNSIGPLPDKAFFDALLGHIGGVTDAPCNLFCEELVSYYPDAKVILVEREIQSWHRSWMAFLESAYDPVMEYLGKLKPFWLGRLTQVGGTIMHISAGFAETKD